jgi:hypothetical protein
MPPGFSTLQKFVSDNGHENVDFQMAADGEQDVWHYDQSLE